MCTESACSGNFWLELLRAGLSFVGSDGPCLVSQILSGISRNSLCSMKSEIAIEHLVFQSNQIKIGKIFSSVQDESE